MIWYCIEYWGDWGRTQITVWTHNRHPRHTSRWVMEFILWVFWGFFLVNNKTTSIPFLPHHVLQHPHLPSKHSSMTHPMPRSVLANSCRDHFVYAPSQWQKMLPWNVVSHWLDAYTKWSLQLAMGPVFGQWNERPFPVDREDALQNAGNSRRCWACRHRKNRKHFADDLFKHKEIMVFSLKFFFVSRCFLSSFVSQGHLKILLSMCVSCGSIKDHFIFKVCFSRFN